MKLHRTKLTLKQYSNDVRVGHHLNGDARLSISKTGDIEYTAEYVGPKFDADICMWLEKFLPPHHIPRLIGNVFLDNDIFGDDPDTIYLVLDEDVHTLLYERYGIRKEKVAAYPVLWSFSDEGPYHVFHGYSLPQAMHLIKHVGMALTDLQEELDKP